MNQPGYTDYIMDLNIKDISTLLQLPEKKISALIKSKELPSEKVNDKFFFNKQKIIEWALGRNIPLNLSNHEKLSEYRLDSLSALLDPAAFYYDCRLEEKTFIEQMIGLINLDESVDKDIIIQLLRSREALMSTAIGNGVSFPHPRIPLALGNNKPLINFFFPQKLLDLKSIDNKPVHTIILIISQTIKQHLSILARISFLISKEIFHAALKNRKSYEEIIDLINQIENNENG